MYDVMATNCLLRSGDISPWVTYQNLKISPVKLSTALYTYHLWYCSNDGEVGISIIKFYTPSMISSTFVCDPYYRQYSKLEYIIQLAIAYRAVKVTRHLITMYCRTPNLQRWMNTLWLEHTSIKASWCNTENLFLHN